MSQPGNSMNNIEFDLKKVEHYDDLARKAVFGYDQLFLMVLSHLVENQNETKNVLIVGCGTGMELTTFGKLMPNWHLTGVDPSQEMIGISKTKIESQGLSKSITLHNGFVESMSEEEDYDTATLIFVLRFIPDDKSKLELFQNIIKRLKSGGKFVVVDQYGDPNSEDFQNVIKAWRKFMYLNLVPSELATKIADQAIGKGFITETRLQQLLSDAGFEKPIRFYDSFMHGGWIVQKK